jgi:hypothetical protein
MRAKLKGEKMNYLDLINKCLVELNYKQVNAFSELTKNDHKKIKNILNVLNAEICGCSKWEFLLREAFVNAQTAKIPAPNGRIEKICIDGKKIKLETFGNEIILPEQGKDVSIIYYTNDCAVDADGVEKAQLEVHEDKTLIPMPFAEPLLVYGTCMRLKGNPQHVRFNYWYNMYKDALANLRSKICIDANAAPSVKLFRR